MQFKLYVILVQYKVCAHTILHLQAILLILIIQAMDILTIQEIWLVLDIRGVSRLYLGLHY